MRKNKAFTLVELLVVVAIITVLIAILLPSLGAAKQQSATVVCASGLKQIGLAAQMYYSENDGWAVPFAWQWNGAWLGQPNSPTPSAANPNPRNWYRWHNYLRPYTNTYKVFNCPTMTLNKSSSTMGQPSVNTACINVMGEYDRPSWVYPGNSGVGISCNYGMVPSSWQEDPGLLTSGYTGSGATWASVEKKLTAVLDMYQTYHPEYGSPVFIMDGVERTYQPTDTYFGTNLDLHYVHYNNTANVLFYDGHVERHVKADFRGGAPTINGKLEWMVGVKN